MAKQILSGDQLMVFDSNAKSIGFATNHVLSISTEQSEITSKDHNGTRGIKINRISWEVQCSHLYTAEEVSSLFDTMMQKKPVYIYFGQKKVDADPSKTVAADDWNAWSIDPTANVADSQTESVASFSQTLANPVSATHAYYGKAYITSLNINAPTGDNANFEVVFSGDGPLTKCTAPN